MGERDHAFGGLVEAGDTVEDGGLSGAVRTDDRGDIAALCREGKIADGDEAAEAHGQMIDLEYGSVQAAHPCPSFTMLAEMVLVSFNAMVGVREDTRPRG